MGMSQMCTGAGDYFRTSKPHSEKLCTVFYRKKPDNFFSYDLTPILEWTLNPVIPGSLCLCVLTLIKL